MKRFLTETNISDEDVKYKPLGFMEDKMYVYSKHLKTVRCLSPDKTDDVLRSCIRTHGFEEMPAIEKRRIANLIYDECVRVGQYQPEAVLGVGLWEADGSYYFNTGNKMYKKVDTELLPIPYANILKNNFLPIKTRTEFKTLPQTDIKDYLTKLEGVLRDCDWVHPFYGSVLLGFIAQSYYAGCIEGVRPHLWILSKGSTQGKSWLSGWVKKHLVPHAFTREGDFSTPAGSRQAMANNSVLFIADELGEKGTSFKQNALMMLQLLRSASTAKSPVILGTAEQQVILQKVKFSALIACIEGRGLLKEQDFYRFVFLTLQEGDKERFNKEMLPRFNALQDGTGLGFAYHAVARFHLYQKYYGEFETTLSSLAHGHRIRGLASILAGYSAIFESKEKGYALLEELKTDTDMFSKYSEDFDDFDAFGELMNKIIPKNELGFMSDTPKRFIDAAREGHFTHYGIVAKGKTLCINVSQARDLLVKYMQTVDDAGMISRMLKNSKNFLKVDRVRNGADVRRFLQFDISKTD